MSRKIVTTLVLAAVLLAFGLASLVRLDVPAEKLEKKYMDAATKTVNIDGLKTYYKDEGTGYPLVLLHGAASSLQTWDDCAVVLDKDFRVIRLDLPGYGLTGPNREKNYSMEWYIKFLDDFLGELRVNKCYIAGNSFGGRIAWEYALGRKEKVTGLVLIDAGGYASKKSEMTAAKLSRVPALRKIVRYITPKFFVAMNLRQIYGDNTRISDKTIDRYYDMMLRAGNRDTFGIMNNAKFADGTREIKTISVPTLILWGSKDIAIPVEDAHRFNSDIAGSKLIVYEGAGHVPMEEMPQKVSEDIKAFLLKTGLSIKNYGLSLKVPDRLILDPKQES